MWGNIWGGFLIPSVLGLWLFKKDKKLVLRIVPFVWVIAIFVCLWGDYKKFWILKPKLKKRQYLTTMPLNIGLYPISGVLMIYLIKNKGEYVFWVITFSLFTTLAEFCAVLFGKVNYGSSWNIIKTFFSYLIPYYLVYRYYLWTNFAK